MTLIKKLLLFGVPTVAVGGAGIGILISQSKGKRAVSPENNLSPEQKKRIKEAGLSCKGADCTILAEGLNVDKGGDKKEGYILSGTESENGKIRLRISDDETYKDKLSFTITKKTITLKSKTEPTQTITLDKYENYGLEKGEGGKVYLTRKLTAEQGKIKSLGLPDNCTLPTTVSSEPPTNTTCKLSTDQIKSVNFDEKKKGGATMK